MATSLKTLKNIKIQLVILFALVQVNLATAQQIIDVSPNVGKLGTTLDVVISGDQTHFGQGTAVLETSVWLSQATSTTNPNIIFPNSVNVESLTKMKANFSINLGTPQGSYNVNTMNGTDGLVSLIYGFNINNWPVGMEEFKDQYGLEIFPNPVVDAVNVKLNLKSDATVRLTLYDLSGREIATQKAVHSKAGANTYKMDLNSLDLEAGTYLVRVLIDKDVAVMSVIKQ